MKSNNERSKQHIANQAAKINQLNQSTEDQKQINIEKRDTLLEYERQFNFSEKVIRLIARLKRGTIRKLRSGAAYVLGRRDLRQLYSRTYKTKKAQNTLKSYKHNLYDLGFVDRGLAELKAIYNETKDDYMLRASAWELALWYANKPTQDDALRALNYLDDAERGEKQREQLRHISIIKAECLERLGELEKGKQIIQHALKAEKHPDLYLAAANLEISLEQRLKWINKALDHYNITPITFSADMQHATYDDLMTKQTGPHVEGGPTVSVILPAYNAEVGIQVAIESMLNQTWKNIELIVVDDCSTDNTVKVVESYVAVDARVQLFSTPENSGPYVARNIGLQAATGDFITINDADDWSHASKIETQIQHLINNPDIVANSSEHSRLTESLHLYRRGTPGTYIFPNMSSIMFRRKKVLEKLGSWDSVRFAADGEFKRRLLKTFGKEAVLDLKTGPLSLPRQTVTSLTGSSKFGYNGFFMGARKEYVDSLEHYHRQTDNLYYPFPQTDRPFPVPEPMRPQREVAPGEARHVDVLLATDFYMDNIARDVIKKKLKIHKQMGLRTGFVQLSCYNMTRVKDRRHQLREFIDGRDVQMLVYGESITCEVLIVINPETLQEKQTYIPDINPNTLAVVIDRLLQRQGKPSDMPAYNLRQCQRRAMDYFNKRGLWYPARKDIQEQLQHAFKQDIKHIHLAPHIWLEKFKEQTYKERLEDWLI